MSLIKENKEILEVAVEASLAASNIIMEAAHDPQISNFKKSRSDLVTTADIESEKIIKLFILYMSVTMKIKKFYGKMKEIIQLFLKLQIGLAKLKA